MKLGKTFTQVHLTTKAPTQIWKWRLQKPHNGITTQPQCTWATLDVDNETRSVTYCGHVMRHMWKEHFLHDRSLCEWQEGDRGNLKLHWLIDPQQQVRVQGEGSQTSATGKGGSSFWSSSYWAIYVFYYWHFTRTQRNADQREHVWWMKSRLW